LGSRCCKTDHLSDVAWSLFGSAPLGWARVQAICDYVHDHITFGYEHSRATRTAVEAFEEKRGVCRDYAHLALTFCRRLMLLRTLPLGSRSFWVDAGTRSTPAPMIRGSAGF
jgi:transglutaminase-like putative cysteine protease